MRLLAAQNSTMKDCTVSSLGDATWSTMVVFNGTNIELSNTVFQDYNATNQAAGVNIVGATFLMSNCSFKGGSQLGFLVQAKDSNITIRDSNFADITSYTAGTGLQIQANQSQVFISNSTFERNVNVPLSGGAISLEIVDVNLTVIDCLFQDNVAQSGGAVNIIANFSGSILVSNNTVRNCSTANLQGGGGGYLFLFYNSTEDTLNVTIQDSLFEKNRAIAGAGIAFGLGSATTLSLTNLTFRNNFADAGGGLLLALPANLTHCRFEYNNATQYGGAISFISTAEMNLKGNLTFEDCYFGNNVVDGGAGAAMVMLLPEGIDVLIRDCLYEYNSQVGVPVTLYGGALSLAMSENHLAMINTTFRGNSGQYIDGIDFHISVSPDDLVFDRVVSATSCYIEIGNAVLAADRYRGITTPRLTIYFSGQVRRLNLEQSMDFPGFVKFNSSVLTIPVPDITNTSGSNVTVMTYQGLVDPFSEVVLMDPKNGNCTPAVMEYTDTAFKISLKCKDDDSALTPPPGGLSGGAIAGIVVGCVVGVAIAVVLLIFLLPTLRHKVFPHRQPVRTTHDGVDTRALEMRDATPLQPEPTKPAWNKATPTV